MGACSFIPLTADEVWVGAEDWAAMPFSGDMTLTGPSLSGNPTSMSRVNFLRNDPVDPARMWVCDLNGNLHLFAKGGTFASRSAELLAQAHARTPYLDFNGQAGTSDNPEKINVPNADGTATSRQNPDGMFRLIRKGGGYANGLVTFQFDPDYANNGTFYTVHTELSSADGSATRLPVAAKHPGFNSAGYTSTNVISPPDLPTADRHAVLIEWTDSDTSDGIFEGTARELLRIAYRTRIHPLGDITFNPAAEPGDPDWRVMYLASGDGGAGESNANDDGVAGVTGGDRHHLPQRLDSLVGKVLRIIPDTGHQTGTSTLSANGRYRIPNDNPFTGVAGARGEVWSYGLRNPHRFAWADNPLDPGDPHLLVCDIGLHAWEEVNLIRKGGGYGYAQREGPQTLLISTNSALNRTLGQIPADDTLPVRVNATETSGTHTPVYPVIAYPHANPYGDAISSGFLYKGSEIPVLEGKFVFGDITTGRLFYSDFEEMLAADDGDAATMAEIHAVRIFWDDPNDLPDAGVVKHDSMFGIAKAGYEHRGGTDSDLPGGSTISGTGRADIRLFLDEGGEIYVTGKSDGMIRRLAGGPVPVIGTPPQGLHVQTGDPAGFSVVASGPGDLQYQWFKGPVAIEGANSASYMIGSATKANEGIYGVEVRNPAGPVMSATAQLSVEAPDPYGAWAAGIEWGDADSTPGGDADSDGFANLLEYAVGSDPLAGSAAGLPELGIIGDEGERRLTLTFRRVADSSLTYAVMGCEDLFSWTNVWTSTGAANVDGVVTVEDSVDLDDPGILRRFLLLRVSR